MTIHHQDDRVTLHHGDCLDVLRSLPDASVDSVVCDPPYGLEFMGKDWDAPWQATTSSALFGDRATRMPGFGRSTRNATCRTCSGRMRGANKCACESPAWDEEPRATVNRQMRAFDQWCELWAAECLRVLKPGGHLLAFGGTRTWHRLACAVEDAGFEVRDSIAWMHGQGFPKSQNVSMALGDRRCQCEKVELTHDGDVRGMRDDVPATAEPRRPGEVADLLAPVQRQGAGSGVGEVRSAGAEDARPLRPEDGRSEPGVEGRRDVQAAEGELCGSALRALPVGVPGDGEGGWLRDGAPSRDGSPAGPVSAALGSGESHQPRPAGQPTGESRAVPVERGSQAWGGWPVCGRCGKPSIPDGLGTAAKPAFEPVVVARKPLVGTVAANVLTHGTGALNIDATRIGHDDDLSRYDRSATSGYKAGGVYGDGAPVLAPAHTSGRWPANVILDEDMATRLDQQSGTSKSPASYERNVVGFQNETAYAHFDDQRAMQHGFGDSGGASRFFYVAKAPKRERPVVDGVAHPTVKPLALMRWLVRLVTPPGGVVLEPFAGSGTTVEACLLEGFRCVAIEKGDEYLPLILARIERQQLPEAAELTRTTDPEAAIVEQIEGQLDIFGEGQAS